MAGVTEKELKNYYSQINRLIICEHRQKKDFLKQFDENVQEYISDAPGATLADIEKNFGTPETIAESFIVNADSTRIKKQVQIKRVIVISVIIALIIYALFVVISLIDVHTEAHGYFEEGFLTVSSIIKGGGII